MPTLVIYSSNDRQHSVTLWPISAQPLPEGLIEEKHSYNFELREIANPDTAELYIDDEALEALRSPDASTARWKWTPDFYAGRIRVRLKHSGGQSELELTVDPDLSKITRSEFDSMVRDILADTTALFSLSGFRFGVAKGAGSSVPPLARLEFLRSRVTALETAVAGIARKPVRVLSRDETVKPLAAARTVTSRDIYRSFYKSRLQPAPPHFRIGALEVPALPTRLTVGAKTASEDIAENRAIKTCLQSWKALLFSFSEILAAAAGEDDDLQTSTRRRWSRRCRSLARRLSRLLDLPLFAEMPDTPTPLRVSPIFRRVPQYHRFFLLYRDMNLGFAQIQGDFLDMPLSRTFDIYELWVFLRICRAVAERRHVNTSMSEFFTHDSELGIASLVSCPSLAIEGGVQLRFKRQYVEYWRDEQNTGSFSRRMIPDISVETAGAAGAPTIIIILDAKYRVEHQLDDALASIHMYRDAIVREEGNEELRKIVVAAYLISPHIPVETSNWRDAKPEDRLFHPEYREKFRFGALTLRPGTSVDDAQRVLDRVIADATRA